jgi:hypothetical protein
MSKLGIRIVLGLTLGLGTALAPVASNGTAMADSAVKAKKPDMQRMADHLRQHVKYPATRKQILDACADTDEFSAGEKAWAAAHLPQGTYASPDEVLEALGK